DLAARQHLPARHLAHRSHLSAVTPSRGRPPRHPVPKNGPGPAPARLVAQALGSAGSRQLGTQVNLPGYVGGGLAEGDHAGWIVSAVARLPAAVRWSSEAPCQSPTPLRTKAAQSLVSAFRPCGAVGFTPPEPSLAAF